MSAATHILTTQPAWLILACGDRVAGTCDTDTGVTFGPATATCHRHGDQRVTEVWPNDPIDPPTPPALTYPVAVTCAGCGGPLVHAADGRGTDRRRVAAMKCQRPGCRRGWVLHVQLLEGAP